MIAFSLEREIRCDEQRFWKLFFDPDFNRTQFIDGLEFPKFEILEQRESDTEIFRRAAVTPKLDVPGPVAKLLGPSFSYVEEATFDKQSKRLHIKLLPPPGVLKDKLRMEAKVRIEPITGASAPAVRRITDFEIEARMFGVGGLLEGASEKSLRTGWEKSADFMNRWLAEHPS